MEVESDQAPEFDQRPEYNDWLDEQYFELYGDLDIFGFKPRPSFVLHKLSIDTYEAAYADYQTQNEDQLKEIVISEFPAPIAHFFYRLGKILKKVRQSWNRRDCHLQFGSKELSPSRSAQRTSNRNESRLDTYFSLRSKRTHSLRQDGLRRIE
jgi:hypothetical protein